LLLLPIIAVAILAFTLAYGFHEVQLSARRVDHADRVIAQANNLVKLMVDEETGLRGFLLTHDPIYLAPYQQANRRIEPEFQALLSLTKDPPQVARLQRWQAQFRAWQQYATAVANPSARAPVEPSQMLERKRQMDAMRATADEFLAAEQEKRASRWFTALRVDNVSFYGMIGLAALVGLVLAWEIRRIFERLAGTYKRQMNEIKLRGEESYAREQWLSTTLRSIGDAVIACDPEGKVVFMNQVAEHLTGWREKEAHGQPLPEIFRVVNEHTRATVTNPVDLVRETGKVVGLANHTILIAQDKREFYIDDSAAPILDSQSRMIGIVLIFRDISERHASEQALMRTEKLASAGRLAAAIAHEVNNPLEGLVNLVYLARAERDSEKIRGYLGEAERELQRIAHITRQSLGFYRENSSAGLFRPDVVTREVFEFYSSRAAIAKVALRVNIKTERQAFGNPGELRQVLSNLLTNSLDACEEGDFICVKVREAVSPASHQAGVRISLADTGCGIPEENLKRVFEPFFTTKKDIGTGLGLWVSRELIEKQGGRVAVRSRVNGAHTGTVFSLFLPGLPVNSNG
jgi:PAS domain S-box-containing protein